MFNKRTCFIKTCAAKSNKLFKFPQLLDSCPKLKKLSILRQKKWKIAIKAAAIPNKFLTKHCAVCSEHFISGKPAKIHEFNNSDWVPSLRLKINNNSNVAATNQLEDQNENNITEPINFVDVEKINSCTDESTNTFK